MKLDFPKKLFLIFLLIWIITFINPPSRIDNLIENIIVFIFLPIVLLSYYKFRLSNFSYFLIFIFGVLHITAAHYGYWNTPWGNWFKDVLDWERNHYDRMVHFLFGFLMTPVFVDLLKKYLPSNRLMAGVFVFGVIFSIGSFYEIAEFVAGLLLKPEAGLSFLGFQGDIWDTQKDMIMQGTGSVLSFFVFKSFIIRFIKNQENKL